MSMQEDNNGKRVKPQHQDHFKGAPPMHPFESCCQPQHDLEEEADRSLIESGPRDKLAESHFAELFSGEGLLRCGRLARLIRPYPLTTLP